MEHYMSASKKILIVDDEEINLDFFEVMLGNLGFEVFTAKNGDEGLEAVRKHKPHLVILDNMMPRKTGWEVTKILKTNPDYAAFAETPIIMFSAMDDTRDKVEGFSLGVDDYITKPFNFNEVFARIKTVLRNRDLINQIERRERRLAVVERIGERIGSYVEELKLPLDRALTSISSKGAFGEREKQAVTDEIRLVLERLDAMHTEVASLKSEAEELKRAEMELESIRRQLREHNPAEGAR
jgi:DNA-binding response OmpR family regulator